MKVDAKAALRRVDEGVGCLDGDDVAGATAKVDEALGILSVSFEDDWMQRPGAELLQALRDPDAGRALARALWLGSTVDELQSNPDRARLRCLRAMELYARLRGTSEALDMRAARELGSASARLGATAFSAAHGRST